MRHGHRRDGISWIKRLKGTQRANRVGMAPPPTDRGVGHESQSGRGARPEYGLTNLDRTYDLYFDTDQGRPSSDRRSPPYRQFRCTLLDRGSGIRGLCQAARLWQPACKSSRIIGFGGSDFLAMAHNIGRERGVFNRSAEVPPEHYS
jgi:hypothetical protein